jgi:hypothetical protein
MGSSRCVHSVAITGGRWPAGLWPSHIVLGDLLTLAPLKPPIGRAGTRIVDSDRPGLSCRPWNTSRGRLRGLEAKVEWLAHADRAGQRADAHGRGTRSEKSRHRHTTARSSRISVRLFFPYLKRYQPVTGTKSGPLPLRGYRLHTSYSRCGRYTQYLTPRRRPSLRSAQAPRHLEGWVTLTAPVAHPSRRHARHGSSG